MSNHAKDLQPKDIPPEQLTRLVEDSSRSSMNEVLDVWGKPPDKRTPIEKLHDFGAAAIARATDPAAPKTYVHNQIEKAIGIGEGLNQAKEEIKATVVDGWKALNDGTITRFLSKPSAIYDTLSKAAVSAIDAMSKDPNATNKALEIIGSSIKRSSDRYSALSDREKGREIGEVMFAFIAPEASEKVGEATFKVVDQVATHVDRKTMEAANILKTQVTESSTVSPDKALRVEPNKAGAGGDWLVINERPSSDVVKQTQRYSCVSAVGEMLSEGAIDQAALTTKLGAPVDIRELAQYLGPDWRGEAVPRKALDPLLKHSCWGAELRELPGLGYRRIEPGHAVVVDGLNEDGHILIRDPADGTKYEMTRENFLEVWSGLSIFRD